MKIAGMYYIIPQIISPVDALGMLLVLGGRKIPFEICRQRTM